MRIQEHTPMPSTWPTYFQAMVLEAIRNLEADYQDGQVAHDAYYFRIHALERMLR